MSDKLRVAVFGVGSLGQWHAAKYAGIEEAELVGVFDTDPKRAAEIADKHDTRAFDNMEDLADAADAASVVVPTHLHHDIFHKLADHDLHMLMEKPIAVTTTEAEQMVALARRKNLILQVGHIERFNPVMAFLEANMQAPTFIEAIRMCTYPPAREGAPRDRSQRRTRHDDSRPRAHPAPGARARCRYTRIRRVRHEPRRRRGGCSFAF